MIEELEEAEDFGEHIKGEGEEGKTEEKKKKIKTEQYTLKVVSPLTLAFEGCTSTGTIMSLTFGNCVWPVNTRN